MGVGWCLTWREVSARRLSSEAAFLLGLWLERPGFSWCFYGCPRWHFWHSVQDTWGKEENPGKSLLCFSLDPEVHGQSACFSSPLRVFLRLFIYNVQGFGLYLVGEIGKITSPSGFPGDSVVKNLPDNAKDSVWSLGCEDALEKEMATHSSILAWEIPWTEEPGGLQSMGLQKSQTRLIN